MKDKNRPFLNSKTYYVLPQKTWSPLIAEHFWVHTQLPCCLAFRKAAVYPNGHNYITVVSRCASCESQFTGTVKEKPPGNARVLMHCSYIGNFEKEHTKHKKRRIIGPLKEKALISIIDDQIGCETYREQEAGRLMTIEMVNLTEEVSARESWNRKQRKSRSYMIPNPHLRYLDINNSRSMKCLPILKNGSRFEELKSSKIINIPGKFIFSNTCAFDSIASIMMVSYCDSQKYSEIIDTLHSDYFNFISNIVKKGITAFTYSTRANRITKYLEPELRPLEYNTTLAVCDSTVGHIMSKLMTNFPSIKEVVKCSSSVCPEIFHRDFIYITYQTDTENSIDQLQQFLNDRANTVDQHKCKSDYCNGVKTVKSDISNMHLFIDILYWEGENIISNQRSSEAAKLVKIRLCDIPQLLILKTQYYELRGVLCFIRGKSGLRNSIGHYKAYAKRYGSNWELYDDFKKNLYQ